MDKPTIEDVNDDVVVGHTQQQQKLDTTMFLETEAPADVTSQEMDPSAAPDDIEEEAAVTFENPAQSIVNYKISIKTPVDLGTIQVHVTMTDLISDIHKYLHETTETCLLTNYNLVLGGKKLNEFLEIGNIPDLKDGSILEMQPAPYTERTAKLHIKRLKDITNTGGQEELHPNNPTFFSNYEYTAENPVAPVTPPITEGEETAAKDGDVPEVIDEEVKKEQIKAAQIKEARRLKKLASKPQKPQKPQKVDKKALERAERRREVVEIETYGESKLSNFFPRSFTQTIPCTRRFNMSGWNPVPGSRALAGDLFYFEVELYDVNHILYITANTTGFYVNQSTSVSFNPSPSSKYPATYHDLHSLLSHVSVQFSRSLKSVLKAIGQRHPFEMIANIVPANTWISKPRSKKYDLATSDESNLAISDPDLRGQPRDWNEELQSLKELPKASIQERVLRDRAFVKVNSDFVDSAIRGAQVVVSKSIPPINPLEPEKSHMFVYNNIFFSFALDTRDFYADCGGDRAARSASNNDLKGVKLFNLVDIEGISTICTAIVDFRGHRVIAQSLVPGILSNEKTSVVHYGSMDSGRTIMADEAFHDRLKKVAAMLHLAEREVTPLDFMQTSGKPVTLCTSYESKGIVGTDGRKYILDIVRATPRDPNFLEVRHQHCILRPELIANYAEFKRIEWEDKVSKIKARKAIEGEVISSEDEALVNEKAPHIVFNPNLHSNINILGGSVEEQAKDVEELAKVGIFLKETMIKKLVEDFSLYNSTPVDGQTLTAIMHSRGINMRYLGHISSLCEKIPFVKELCFNEMVSRAAKHLFNEALVAVTPAEISIVAAHFLNCFLGTDTGASSSRRPTSGPARVMTQQSLWAAIIASIKEKYSCDLPTASVPLEARISVLRALCLKTGLQVLAKDYDYPTDEPFSPADIVDMLCVVKHLNPRSPDAIDLLESGKTYLAQKKIELAQDHLVEALNVCQQVHGPIHTDTANCYSNLAMVSFYNEQYDEAIEFQKNALVITEKTLGVDHHDTIHSYNNLALFCQRAGRLAESMGYLKHVLYLTDLLGSEFNPERSSIYTSIAILLQEMEKLELSIVFLNRCIENHKHLFGEDHLVSTPCWHSIAIVHAQLGQWTEAVECEKRAQKILEQFLGVDHPRTAESKEYVLRFDEQVRIQKELSRRALLQQNQPTAATTSKAAATQQTTRGGRATVTADDTVEKMLQYINPSKKSSSSKKKKSTGSKSSKN
eukprot:gene13448-15850_t